MKLKKFFILFIFLILFLSSQPTYAAGGNINNETLTNLAVGQTETLKVYNFNTSYSNNINWSYKPVGNNGGEISFKNNSGKEIEIEGKSPGMAIIEANQTVPNSPEKNYASIMIYIFEKEIINQPNFIIPNKPEEIMLNEFAENKKEQSTVTETFDLGFSLPKDINLQASITDLKGNLITNGPSVSLNPLIEDNGIFNEFEFTISYSSDEWYYSKYYLYIYYSGSSLLTPIQFNNNYFGTISLIPNSGFGLINNDSNFDSIPTLNFGSNNNKLQLINRDIPLESNFGYYVISSIGENVTDLFNISISNSEIEGNKTINNIINTNSNILEGTYSVYDFWYLGNSKPGFEYIVYEELPSFNILIGNEPTSNNLSVVSSNNAFGKVNGSGQYQTGTQIYVSASANEGYTFLGWYDAELGNLISKENNYVVDINSSVNLIALFNQFKPLSNGTVPEYSIEEDNYIIRIEYDYIPADYIPTLKIILDNKEISELVGINYQFKAHAFINRVRTWVCDISIPSDSLKEGNKLKILTGNLYILGSNFIESFGTNDNKAILTHALEFNNINNKQLDEFKFTVGNSQSTVIQNITLSENLLNLKIGETKTLGITFYPSSASNLDILWTTSNSKVAQVNSNGNIIAISNGTAIITAKTLNGKVYDTCTVNVNSTPDKVILSKEKVYLSLKGVQTTTITANIFPEGVSQNIIWTSSEPNVATVTGSTGTATITAIAEGKSIITARIGNISAQAEVIVSNNLFIAENVNITSPKSPDYFTVNVKVVTNPALKEGNLEPELVSMFLWSEEEMQDINAKQSVKEGSYWSFTFPVNDNAFHNFFYNADNIKMHIYASDDKNSNGQIIYVGKYKSVNNISAPSQTIAFVSYLQNIGFQKPTVFNNDISGSINENRHIEGIRVSSNIEDVEINTIVHAQNIGWMTPASDGSYAGTMHENRQLEAVKFLLEGSKSQNYNIKYRVYVRGIGWTNWVMNGQTAGTVGENRPIEALQIDIQEKN